MTLTRRVLLTAATTLALAPAAHAGTSVTGKYGCTYDTGNSGALLPSNGGLTLKTNGHYSAYVTSANAQATTGTYKKSTTSKGTKISFKGGALDGKTGKVGKTALTGSGIQIRFASWPATGKAEVCRRSR